MEEELRRETTRDGSRGEEGGGRAKDYDPFNHPRDRRGYFRSSSKKLSRLEPNNRVNIFSFLSRDSLPGVDSGYIERKDNDTYMIALRRGQQVNKIVHEGPIDKDYLQQTMLDYGFGTPNAQTTLNVDSRGKVDAVVTEYARGFSAVSGLPVAGNPLREHWVMAHWGTDHFTFQDDLTANQAKFLSDNKAVIGYKPQPGADPELDYYKSRELAAQRFDMLKAKYG